ncbi:MAG: hypothetical protein ACYTFT_11735, partial [Planctomycetota bacterium]
GAFVGLLVGITTIALVANLTEVFFLWYNVIAAVTVFATGHWITRMLPEPAKSGQPRGED